MQKDLLWENSSPSSNFAAQTLQLGNLSKYASIQILLRYNTGTVAYQNLTIWRLSDTQRMIAIMYADTNNKRKAWRQYNLTWSTGALVIKAALYNNGNANDSLYPIKIYGIKGNTRSEA